MSHVAEGELHAWLDGALDQLGEARARRVREHLRACAACQQALAAEEAIRSRAAEVLGLAAPTVAEMVPFETLVERARAGAEPVAPVVATTRGRLSRVTRLGWAASVVIALGAGWMAREVGVGPMDPRGASGAPPAPTDGSSDVVAALPESGENEAAPSETESAPLPVMAAPSEAELAADQSGSIGGVAGSAAMADRVASVPPSEVLPPPAVFGFGSGAADAVATLAPPSVSPPAVAMPLRERQTAAPPAAEAAKGAAAPERVAETTAGRAANTARRESLRQERSAVAVAPDPTAGIGIQRARPGSVGAGVPKLFVEGRAATGSAAATVEADLDEAKDLIVPGLEVLLVEWSDVAPGRPGLRVLQRLASGDTLEVRFVRSGGAAADAVTDPLAALLETMPVGWSQVVKDHRDGWLVARARLPREELAALVAETGSRR